MDNFFSSFRRRVKSCSSATPGCDRPFRKNCSLRLVVMGAAKVGKTQLIKRYLSGEYTAAYKATVEDTYQKNVKVGGTRVDMTVVDTSGEYSFPAMRRLNISTGDVFMLVFSLRDESSFEEVRKLREEILEIRGKDSKTPIVIVGNQSDLDKRSISKNILDATVTIDWEDSYIETSSKDNCNVENAFVEAVRKIVSS